MENNSNELEKSQQFDDVDKSQFNDLSISLTYSLNIKSIVAIPQPSENNSALYSTTFFKVCNLKCLNCATDMCYYKNKETEKAKITITCNLCGIFTAPNAEGFLLCRNCDFALCHKCRVCSNGHYLKKICQLNIEKLPNFIKKNFTENAQDLKCNLCGTNCLELNKSIWGFNPFYICWTCVYLICNKCMMRTKGIV